MGGAKSVILLDKPGQKTNEAKARAMGRFVNTFGGTYIAAEDVGVDTQFIDWMASETPYVMGGETVSTGGSHDSPQTGCFIMGKAHPFVSAFNHLLKCIHECLLTYSSTHFTRSNAVQSM